MVGASKILTVSYGTFSCTLEGFDDPFNAMRSIAEYFRDLAAEDRYFGAEPPTPDVTHLHALAQQANPQPVAAHVQENGLRLTQTGTDVVTEAKNSGSPAAALSSEAATPAVADNSSPRAPAATTPEDDDDLALLLDGIDEQDDVALPDDDGEEGNLFDVEAAEEAPAPKKPAFDPRAALAAKLAAARETVDAADAEDKKPRKAVSISQEDLEAAKAKARAKKRPDAFREDLDSLNAGQSELSEDEEAALMAELEALQADGDASGKSRDGKALLESDLIEREEAALDRLMAKTNSKLSDGDVQQKRASLAHLKAAVAATMADRKSSEDHGLDDSDPDQAYRADLEKAVRPKAEAAPAEKPAPLVLVSDNAPAEKPKVKVRRIETGQKSSGPVRPRRVEADQKPKTRKESDANFAAYAEQVGAVELSDLMEAAGAYLNLVEGAESFTRPQVMHMVLRQEKGKNFTREDSLRSFDSLVRKGMIHKVDHGQFAIHEDSRFVS